MGDIAATLKGINANSFQNEGDRKMAVAEAHALLSRIESPWEAVTRMVMNAPPQMAALKVTSDLGLFTKWLEKNDGLATSVADLSCLVQCDAVLFTRLLRHLAATNVLQVDDQDLYTMTPLTRSLVNDDLAVMIDYFFSLSMPLCLHLPEFLQSINYENPSGEKTCFKSWSNEDPWAFFGARPEASVQLGRFMKATASKRGHFTEVMAFHDPECSDKETLLVDIGGSTGHDVQAFRTRYPEASGRIVVQDLPDVIANAVKVGGLHETIEAQGYDFFTPQPIEGAKLYLLHAVLHDWTDADAKRILETLKPALRKNQSKLLIHEIVMPTHNPDPESTGRDWTMLYMASGLERTEKQWEELIQSTGFKINKVWRNPQYVEAVIEAELA